jgi:beta-barrel assembly-enhancing protease
MINYRQLLKTILLLALAIPALPDQGRAGFFDQVIQQVEQNSRGNRDNSRSQQEQPPQQEQPSQNNNSGNGGLVNNLGGMFGISQKNRNMINRGIKTVQAMQPIEEEAEGILGQTISLEAFSRYGGIYRNEALTRYITLVGLTVVEVSDRPDLGYHFAILNSNEQNAFAAPGGYIFVTVGLLRSLRNEAELATVLAHEVAHVDRKHMLNTLQRSSLLSNVSELSMTVMDKDPKLLNGVIDQVSNMLFTNGIDKELEYEADQYGVKYAYWAGYDPNAIQNYLKRLHRSQGKADSVFFTTHPSIPERINRVNRQIAKLHDTDQMATLTKRFKHQMKQLSGSYRSSKTSTNSDNRSYRQNATTSRPLRRVW